MEIRASTGSLNGEEGRGDGMKRDAWEQEFRAVWRREERFLRQYECPPKSPLDQKVSELAPEKLIETLRAAFEKAVAVVFDKGSGVVIRENRRAERQRTYQINAYAAHLQETRRSLRAFSKAADRAGRGSVLLGGAAGIGMGLLGMTLPDVPLVTVLLLKCVYETAESFGFSCKEETERIYALRLIETALSEGAVLRENNQVLEHFAQTGIWHDLITVDLQIKATARRLAESMLYGKALQNIPLAGAVGGAGDFLCLRRVRRYASIKYQKRFLLRRRMEQD